YQLSALLGGERGLVLGMGGGCDVLAALSLSLAWRRLSHPSATVVYATCISPRPLPDGCEEVAPGLYRLPSETVPLSPGDDAYGSVRLELSLPRGEEGSPFLLVVPHDSSEDGDIEELSAVNAQAIHASLLALQVDRVLAVDLGGDSLTGGIAFKGNVELGRDRQVSASSADGGAVRGRKGEWRRGEGWQVRSGWMGKTPWEGRGGRRGGTGLTSC
ncbi:MAG: hypothetical protein SGPRY_009809, partial [Prymnesium sp.]